MIKTFSAILHLAIWLGYISGSFAVSFPTEATLTTTVTTKTDSIATLDESRNRYPAILRDSKNFMAEAVISDYHGDTLEVIYHLSRIFELLMEADQIGEMNLEDKEEFERFNRTFTNLYTTKLV
ncbi:MAG: hypothetical protein QF814_06865, partial [Candidatus Marinimicrobia bacterium]|nr:hypothetical protein [Candidatus Neomarinimicrobiota bacterium]